MHLLACSMLLSVAACVVCTRLCGSPACAEPTSKSTVLHARGRLAITQKAVWSSTLLYLESELPVWVVGNVDVVHVASARQQCIGEFHTPLFQRQSTHITG